jgi:hypothetical protein
MARSQYIYFVRIKATGDLLGAFTVKHEARTWAKNWCGPIYPLERLQLSSMRDGIGCDKTETPIAWE